MSSRPVSDQSVRSVAADTATVAAWTLVSRATGFVRVVTIAAILGPTYFGNSFQTMNLLPNVTFELLAGGLISALIVPLLVRHTSDGDVAALVRVARGFLGALLVLFTVIVAALMLAGQLVAALFSLGVRDEATRALQQRAGWILLVLMAPQLVLYGVVGTAAAVQNSQGRFALPAAAPVIENVGVVVTLVLSAVLFGTGDDLGDISTEQLLLLGGGCSLSVGLHAAVQWWGARRCGISLLPTAGWRDPEVRALAGLARQSLGMAALIGARYLGILGVAGSVPGGVVAVTMALNFFNLPLALGAKPVATALLPRLAAKVGALVDYARELTSGASLAMFLTVPSAVAFVVLSETLARAASFGEMAGGTGVNLVTMALATIAVGMVGETLVIVGTPASYALGDARSPLRAVVLRTLVVMPGMAMSLLLLDGAWVIAGVGLSLSVGDLVAGGVVWRRLQRHLPGHDRLARAVARCLLASLAMAVPATMTAYLIGSFGRSAVADVASALAAGIVGAGVYLLVQWSVGAPELLPVLRRVGARADA